MPSDGRNFFINAAIVNSKDNSRVKLWLWDETDESNAPKFDLEGASGLAILQDVTIENDQGGYYTINATLVPTYEQSIPILESSLLEETNWLEVEWGYILSDGSELKSPLYKGQMGLPEVQLGSETSITLKTEATYAYSAARQTSTRQPFNGKPRMDIIQEVLLGGEPPRKLDFDLQIGNGDAYKKMVEDKITAVQGTMSDWRFAKKLAGEASCILVLEGTTVVVRSYEEMASSKPARLFRLIPVGGTFVLSENGVYPAFSVSSSSMYVFSPGWLSRGVTAPTVDEDKFLAEIEKQALAQELEDLQSRSDPDSQYFTVEKFKAHLKNAPKATKQKKGGGPTKPSPEYPGRKDGAGGALTLRDPKEGRNRDQAEGKMAANASQGAVNLTIESIGIPDLLVGEMVGFEGAGVRFDGNYLVLTYTHGISSSGPATTLNIIKNAHFLSEDRVAVDEQANVEEPDTSEADQAVQSRSGE